MKQNLTALAACLLMALPAAAWTVADAFVNLPDIYCPTLSRNTRFDMAEYAKAGRYDSVYNVFGFAARVVELDTVKQILRVQPASGCDLQMHLFRMDTTTYVASVETVRAPIASSVITIYKDMSVVSRQLAADTDSAFLRLPADMDELEADRLRRLMPAMLVSAEINPADHSIVLTNNTLLTLPEADQKRLAPYVLHPVHPLREYVK